MGPEEFWPHFHLGWVYSELKQYQQASEELTQATRIDPKSANAFFGLGLAYNHLAKYEEAIEAFTQVVQLKPQEADALFNRSFSNLYLGRGITAAADATKYLELSGGRNKRDLYMYLVAHFGYRQAALESDASRILEEAATKIQTRSWPHAVIFYLRREMTAQELLVQATDGDKKTEAQAYIGTDLLLSGKREEAKTYLQWVKDNGNKNFVEYSLAVAQLERITKEQAP